jgi:hypothetical protein
MRILCLLAAVSLAACATDSIDVTRSARPAAIVKGAPFIVLLSDAQMEDPVFQHDGALIVARLEASGLVVADKAAHARYAVMLARIDPHTHPSADSSESEGGYGGGRGGGMGGGGMGGGGFGHHGGHQGGPSASARNMASLRIAIFDLTKPHSREERVFYAESRVPAGRQTSDAVADAMITAALKNFPGTSSESYSAPLPRDAGDKAG